MIPNQSITSISINRGKCLMQVLLYKKIHFVPVMTFPLTSTYMNFNLQLVSKPHILKSYYLQLHNSILNFSQVNPLLWNNFCLWGAIVRWWSKFLLTPWDGILWATGLFALKCKMVYYFVMLSGEVNSWMWIRVTHKVHKHWSPMMTIPQ